MIDLIILIRPFLQAFFTKIFHVMFLSLSEELPHMDSKAALHGIVDMEKITLSNCLHITASKIDQELKLKL